jgi:hypothetical protein
MATIETSNVSVLELAKNLDASAQYELAMTLLSNLKGWMGGEVDGKRKRKQRKQRDPNTPKREVKPDSYIALVNKHVWPVLDSMSKADGLSDEDKKRMRSVSARTQVGKMLWDTRVETADDKTAAIASITRDQIVETFEQWKVSPPTKNVSVSKKSKLAGMTDDEKKAFYKARGVAAAAARAAKKVSESNSKSNPKDDDASSVDSSDSDSDSESEAEAQEVKPYVWEHAMKGADKPTKYERCDIEGRAYLYDIKTKNFLGMWDEKKNKINSDVEDPCA